MDNPDIFCRCSANIHFFAVKSSDSAAKFLFFAAEFSGSTMESPTFAAYRTDSTALCHGSAKK